MPVTVLRRTDGDLTRKYWWVVLLVVLLAGGGSLALLRQGGGAGPGTDPSAGAAQEQSLESIDQGLATVGAPGGPLNLSMEGAATGSYKRRDDPASTMKSGLYESPSTAANNGAPVVATAGSAATGGSLAEALKKVASSKPGKDENKGWGSAAVRTGFTPPKASFSGGLSGLSGGGGGGGGSGASLSLGSGGGNNAFGIGGSNPGSAATVGGGLGLGGGPPKVRKGGHNQAMDILKQVETVSSKAAGAGSDLANNMNQRGFDGNTARAAMAGAGGTAMSGGAVVNSGVAENLKLDDPKLNQKKIEVPGIGKDKPADNSQQMMEQQLMMMVMTMAIGGIMGPMFGAMGTGMANMMFGTNMTYNPGANNNVGSNFGSSNPNGSGSSSR